MGQLLPPRRCRRFLRPLTEHNDGIDVTIHSLISTSHVTTLDALNETLDVIDAGATAPVLVRLKGADAILTIGIGHSTAVVLNLGIRGDPWQATDENHPEVEGELKFTGPNGVFTFYAERIVTPNQACSSASNRSTSRWPAPGTAKAPTTPRPAPGNPSTGTTIDLRSKRPSKPSLGSLPTAAKTAGLQGVRGRPTHLTLSAREEA